MRLLMPHNYLLLQTFMEQVFEAEQVGKNSLMQIFTKYMFIHSSVYCSNSQTQRKYLYCVICTQLVYFQMMYSANTHSKPLALNAVWLPCVSLQYSSSLNFANIVHNFFIHKCNRFVNVIACSFQKVNKTSLLKHFFSIKNLCLLEMATTCLRRLTEIVGGRRGTGAS